MFNQPFKTLKWMFGSNFDTFDPIIMRVKKLTWNQDISFLLCLFWKWKLVRLRLRGSVIFDSTPCAWWGWHSRFLGDSPLVYCCYGTLVFCTLRPQLSSTKNNNQLYLHQLFITFVDPNNEMSLILILFKEMTQFFGSHCTNGNNNRSCRLRVFLWAKLW